tara:strand:+ start:428 stop:1378 length:951 start_codon:yes stop_codon:yes gene_type:complete
MPLKVLAGNQITIGKFGGSFVDLHRRTEVDRAFDGVYLPIRANPAVGNPLFGVNPPCLPGADPKSRRLYAIDTSGLKVPEITNIQAFEEQFQTRICGENDDFLNTDMNKDWADGTSNHDILKSKYGKYVAYTSNTGDRMESLSAISFSLQKDEWSVPPWKPTVQEPVKVWYAKGTASTLTAYNCVGDQTISPPVIVTDKRNEIGTNLTDSKTLRNVTYRGRWYGIGGRFYIEIRHGLNTENYLAMVSEEDYFEIIPKKNSLILARYISLSSAEGNTRSSRRDNPGGIYDLPKGRINVVFFADPCEGTFNGVTQGSE